MSSSVLEATEVQFLERAGEIEEQLDNPQFVPAPLADGDAQVESGQAARRRFFDQLRDVLMRMGRSPAWRTHSLMLEMFILLEDLRDAVEEDSDGTDPQWRQREILQRMLVVVRAMVRQINHDDLDRPERAARYVAQELADLETVAVARLLGTDARMVASYRDGRVGQVRKNPNRMTLVAQLVQELLYSMTPRGALLWFDAPMTQLGGQTPRELLDADVEANRLALVALARGGRGQLDSGTVAVEHPRERPVVHGELDLPA